MTSAAELLDLVTSGSRGWARYYSETGTPFIRIGNLDHGTITIDLSAVQYVMPPVGAEADRTRLRPGDILVSITAELGMIGLVPESLGEAFINQHIALARPCQGIDPRFLAWYLASEINGKRQLQEMRRGATKAGLGLDDIRGVSIPLAPRAEQKRIADKLDAVLARVDACRERLDRVPAILKRFRQAVLADATSGRLTDDWRADQATSTEPWDEIGKENFEATPPLYPVTPPHLARIQPGYELRTLRELVAEPMRNGKSVRNGEGMPVLRLSAIRAGGIDVTSAKGGDWDGIDADRFLIKPGDFLVARGNGSRELVGRGGIVVGEQEQIAFPDTMIRIRFDESRVAPRFVRLIWDIEAVRDQIEFSARTTAGIWKIAQSDLEKLELPVPAIDEQREIVCRVESLFAYADRLEARYQAARVQVERLTPALLAKAFRGELVPQDPDDEPASVLLERIRAARAAAPAKPKRGRGAALRESSEDKVVLLQMESEFSLFGYS